MEIQQTVIGAHFGVIGIVATRTAQTYTTQLLWKGWHGSKIGNFELACDGGDQYRPTRRLPSRPSRILIRCPAGKEVLGPIVAKGLANAEPGPDTTSEQFLARQQSEPVGLLFARHPWDWW